MDVLMDATAGLEAKNGTEIITANATYRDLNVSVIGSAIGPVEVAPLTLRTCGC
jgi:hypothetical protein